MYVRHHDEAVRSGARIVHACGFDSIPHDLGVLFTVEQLPEGVPLTVRGYVSTNGKPSGGTAASALTAFSRVREHMRAGRERRAAEARPADRNAHGERRPPHRELDIGWVMPLPTID